MKHRITITIEVNLKNYIGAGETPKDAVTLAREIILHRADWPDEVNITCGSHECNLVNLGDGILEGEVD